MSWKDILNPVDEPVPPPPPPPPPPRRLPPPALPLPLPLPPPQLQPALSQSTGFEESQRYGRTTQHGEGMLTPYAPAASGSGGSPYSGEEDVVMIDAPTPLLDPYRNSTTTRGRYGVESKYTDDTSVLSVSRAPSSLGVSTPSAEVSTGPDTGDGTEETICYGTIARIDSKVMGNMSEIDKKLLAPGGNGGSTPEYQHFSLSHQTDPGHVQLTFSNGDKFGQLRQKDSRNIEKLMAEPGLRVEFEAVALTRTLRETIGKAKNPSDAIVQVSINVYGPRSQIDEVGEKLSEVKMFLQPPYKLARSVPYDNPHILKFADLDAAPTEIPREVNSGVFGDRRGADEEPENVQDFMNENIFPELRRSAQLSSHAFQGALAIKTPLLKHQRKALDFMTQRETGKIDPQFVLWEKATSRDGEEVFRHKITSEESLIQPEERGGGILADEMGMGKSLSIIALMMERAAEGAQWAESKNSQGEGHGQIRRYTKATLVIVSSALIINTWEAEIQKHLKEPKDVKLTRYHGQRGSINLNTLETADIVITTYNTLATEFAAGAQKSLLHMVKWYRVVLDEAHYIRRQTTNSYKACHDLEAESRWCLTGTPIQNRLDDIGALYAFIRIRPFHSLNAFRRHVTNLYEAKQYEGGLRYRTRATNNLISLLDSSCLRQTREEALEIPEPNQIMRALELTPKERQQYQNTEKILGRIMKERVGEYERYHWAGRGGGISSSNGGYHGSSAQFGMFQVNLQLRILCNHGTFQQPFSWQRQSRRDLLEAEVADPLAAGAGEQFCNGCGILLPVGSDGMTSSKCGHLVCADCLIDSNCSGDAVARNCPLCANYDQQDGDEEDDDRYFRREGVSTKMNKLVEDVTDGLKDSKSIIFSCWTRTLSLVARHLDKAKIPYERIDGMCSMPDRQRRLDSFANVEGKRVLIMTTGTGALGLNLTVANRVFIVELQWNPSVENQAISRAIRLGQKEKVTVTRYYFKDTVEQQMMDQQEGKRKLARIGYGSSQEVTHSVE